MSVSISKMSRKKKKQFFKEGHWMSSKEKPRMKVKQ